MRMSVGILDSVRTFVDQSLVLTALTKKKKVLTKAMGPGARHRYSAAGNMQNQFLVSAVEQGTAFSHRATVLRM